MRRSLPHGMHGSGRGDYTVFLCFTNACYAFNGLAVDHGSRRVWQ